MEKHCSLPLHLSRVNKSSIIINRLHALLHFIAITFLIQYRASFFFQEEKTRAVPWLPWLLVFAAELLLSFIWLLGVAFRWRPISRTVFPERLPEDDKLPAIDVFICTVDPSKEPTVDVMNTVLSAMALDYPPEKLHIYLSDDGGSSIALFGMKEAWKFARCWLPFCKKYGIKTICPKAFFSCLEDDYGDSASADFTVERQKIQKKYMMFKEHVMRAIEKWKLEDQSINWSRDHPSVIEVIQENQTETMEDQVKMPLLVYVSREKRPSHAHNFKAGALNVLLRVSGVMSNSPYILMLDCDMYCNDPTSARQAMCFYLDPNISPSLAFVQFPQKFYNVSYNDIYNGQIQSLFLSQWPGLDGLKGPVLSGTNLYITRGSLLGVIPKQQGTNLLQLKNSFGASNLFLKSLRADNKPSVNSNDSSSTLLQESDVLASCAYENNAAWGEKVGFMYHSLVEDYFTGFKLHCNGWTSVYINPRRPSFLGSSPTNLNDLLIQAIRWNIGWLQVGISKFCPLIYGPLRMSLLQSMAYAELALFPLFYSLSLWCFATIPQLCLLYGIPLYPEVSSSSFYIFLFIFLSALSRHLYEVLSTRGSIEIWRNEQRMWMMKSITSDLYGSLNIVMEKLGLAKANFLPTNKAMDDIDQVKQYQMGIFDFQISLMLLAPLVTLIFLNLAAFVFGVSRMIIIGDWEKMFVQNFLSFYILVMNYALIEGMIVRKDNGRIPPSVTLLSVTFLVILLSLVFITFKL